MSRIVKKIEIEGKKAVALFDTGAWHTYALEKFVSKSPRLTVKKPYKVALGGKRITIGSICLFEGEIDGLAFDSECVPVADLGFIDGHRLDMIVGAVTMEKWEIKLDPRGGKLDLEGLRRREFTEF